ncbi:MAG: BamA/TamA family outer membrane protein [Sphingorhabdus sp.]
MSGCLIFVESITQLAHKTALGMMALCGNGSTGPTVAPGGSFVQDLSPTSHVFGLETEAFVHPVLPPIVTVVDPPRSMPGGALHAAAAAPSRLVAFSTEWPKQAPGVDPFAQKGYYFFDGDSHEPRNSAFSQIATSARSDTDRTHFAAPARVSDAGQQSASLMFTDEDMASTVLEDVGASDQAQGLVPDLTLSRGGITLSGGYSSIEGPMVEASIARRNIGGQKREVSASVRYSKVQSHFEIGYVDGDFLGNRMTFAPALFANRLAATGFGSSLPSRPFSQSARGINILLDRKFDHGLSAAANYRLSDDRFRMRRKTDICDNTIYGSPVCNELGNDTSSILTLSLTLDRRKIVANKIRGFKLRLTQDVAGLGGTTHFARSRFSSEAHVDMGQKWNLFLGADAGYIAPIGDKPIPLFDRFYIGGTSMRGFDLRGIGPKIRPLSAEPSQSVAVGGRVYYAARAELSVPVGGALGRFGLQSCIFVDAGSVFGARKSDLLPGEELTGNSAKPRVSIGLGWALNTPAGKLRLDIAKPVVDQRGDRSKMLSISFGAAI